MSRAQQRFALGSAAFLAAALVAQIWTQGSSSPVSAAAPSEITAEKGADGVVLRSSPSGNGYLVIVDPTRGPEPRARSNDRSRLESATKVAWHRESLTLTPGEAEHALVYELRLVMKCGPGALCKPCQPGPDDACTSPPDPPVVPPLGGPLPPKGYTLHLLDVRRP